MPGMIILEVMENCLWDLTSHLMISETRKQQMCLLIEH